MKNMTSRVSFSKPNFELFDMLGLKSIDMHYHSKYSDTMTKIDNILRKASRLGIGVAITDHNEMKGALSAMNNRYGVPIIPGMEVSCSDGPHILVYFYNASELEAFFRRHIERARGGDPSGITTLSVNQLFSCLENYNCLTSAAHPYGYKLADLGLAKCVRKGFVEEDTLQRVDALEVISGAAPRPLNQKACTKAEEMGKPITGGSDGHTLLELGRIVTCSYADDTDTFLENILKKKNYVVGTETKLITSLFQAGKIFMKHSEYPGAAIKNLYKTKIDRKAIKEKEQLAKRLKSEP